MAIAQAVAVGIGTAVLASIAKIKFMESDRISDSMTIADLEMKVKSLEKENADMLRASSS